MIKRFTAAKAALAGTVKRVVLVGAIVGGLVLLAVAVRGGRNDPVTFTEGGVRVRVEFSDSGLAGDRLKVTLAPEATDGHIAVGARVEVSGVLTPAGEVRLPRLPSRSQAPMPVYSAGTVRAEVPVHRQSDKSGKVIVKLTYQACGKTTCLPTVLDKTVTLNIRGS